MNDVAPEVLSLPGHRLALAIHAAALEAGLKVGRMAAVGQSTLVEYLGATGCYAYMEMIDACFWIDAPFSKVVATWNQPQAKLLIRPVRQIGENMPAHQRWTGAVDHLVGRA